jgi:hypothetical protein
VSQYCLLKIELTTVTVTALLESPLNRHEATENFDIREILKKKEAITDTNPYFFKKLTEGGYL